MTMNDDQVDDLKQYLGALISQVETSLGQSIDGLEQKVGGLEQKIDELDKKMDDGFAAVGDAIDQIHKRDEAYDDRLSKLEQQTA